MRSDVHFLWLLVRSAGRFTPPPCSCLPPTHSPSHPCPLAFARPLPLSPAPYPAVPAGGSSGIGLSLVRRLAADGINVVVVAIPDATLDAAVASLDEQFPDVTFRAVGVKLGSGDYVETIAAATKDLPITLVFNNAGYIVTGFLTGREWNAHLDNINCYATAGVALSHLFVRRIKALGQRGAITFTSSPAGFMPSPFSVLYGATKSFLTHFATSLAAEVRQDGIDVSVLHPSPVATAFYTGAHAMPTLKFFQSTGTGPDRVADALLAGIGRSVIVDQGYYSISLRMLLRVSRGEERRGEEEGGKRMKEEEGGRLAIGSKQTHRCFFFLSPSFSPLQIIDVGFLAELVARTAHMVGDNKVLKQAEQDKAKGAAPAPIIAEADKAKPGSSSVSKRRKSNAR
jgi:short-subunit dehydrogenase